MPTILTSVDRYAEAIFDRRGTGEGLEERGKMKDNFQSTVVISADFMVETGNL